MATNDTTASTETVSAELYAAALNRMNITWEPSEKDAAEIKAAIIEARDYLRDHAGSPALSFDTGTYRTLLLTCTEYVRSKKLADFRADYLEELNTMRLREAFGCGKGES